MTAPPCLRLFVLWKPGGTLPPRLSIDRLGGYSDLSGDLPIALPVGLLVGDQGSSIAGWMFPEVSMARDVTVCSPGVGDQSRCQDRQAKSDLLSSRLAFVQAHCRS